MQNFFKRAAIWLELQFKNRAESVFFLLEGNHWESISFERISPFRCNLSMASRRRRQATNPEEPKRKLNRSSLKELGVLLRYLRPYRGIFFVGMVFLLLSSLTTLVFPRVIGELVDTALRSEKSGDSDGFLGDIDNLALLLLGVLVVQAVFSYFRILIFVTVSEKTLGALRKDLYGRLITLPMGFFGNRRVGELTSRLTSDISLIQDTFTTTLAELLRGLINLLAGVTIIFFISPRLTLVMLASFPVLVMAAVVFGRFIRRISKTAQDKLAEANVVVEETLQGIQEVKSFTNERYERNRYKRAIDEMVRVALKGGRYRGAFSSFIILAIFGAIVLIMWYGATLIANDQLSIGELTSFLIYTAFVGSAIGGFSEYFSQIQRTIGATERIRELLRESPEPVTATEQAAPTQLKHPINGQVVFNDVHFAYPSRPDVPVLQGLNARIEPGQKVALVGTSGAGKSTIVRLLLRFYQVQQGEILVDGKNILEYPLSELRQQTAIVPQDVLLFGGTIEENIRYGRLDATHQEIVAAAEKANADQFIREFPEGYSTVVGERGVKLSGGQRQRIAIARAVLRDPALLLLDEATSSLDSESEKLVQDALDELMKGRTSLIIAHRLATIRNVDNILVLKNGRVAETGTHDTLMAAEDGLYRSLASLQFATEEPLV